MHPLLWPLLMMMMMMMTWQLGEAEDKVCIQCATPTMKENWASSGLPNRPAGLKYDKKCANPDSTFTADALSSNCVSSCFELMVPVDGVYGFVRGCHEHFAWDEMKVTVSNASVICEINQVPDYGSVGFLTRDGETLTTVYAGTSFCQPTLPTSDDGLCNKKLADTDVSEKGVTGCSSGSVHTCKSCGEYDGTGSCSASTSGTCKAAYCTKTIGKMNGHSYESRGCASFNPFARDVCSWSDQTFNVSTGVDTASRSKRGVSFSLQASQCFCQGELCNSTPRFAALPFVAVAAISTSFLVLP